MNPAYTGKSFATITITDTIFKTMLNNSNVTALATKSSVTNVAVTTLATDKEITTGCSLPPRPFATCL